MRDRQNAAVPLVRGRDQAARDGFEGVHVEAGVDLVEHGEARAQDPELDHLGALALAAGEVDVHEAVQQLGAQPDALSLVEHPLTQRARVGAGRLEQVEGPHAGDLEGLLEGQHQSRAGPLRRRQRE